MLIKISEILKNKENNKIIFSAYVCKIAEEVFKEIFGEKYSFQFNFSEDVLVVKVSDGVLISEINFKKDDLIDKINQKLHKKKIKSIKVKIK